MTLSQRHHARCSCAAAPAAAFAIAGTERKYERDRPFRILHLGLDLQLHISKKSVSGAATLEFERVSPKHDSLVLDALGFELKRVRIDTGGGWSDVPYEYDGDQLRISIPVRVERGKIEIDYRATPKRGLYFLAPDAVVKDRPEQVWSQCQDEDARHWFPCHDKPHVKMTTEMRVRVSEGFSVLSNGELVFKDTPKGASPWVFHFKMDRPHPSYLMTLVAGRFDVIEDRDAVVADGRSVPVSYWVPEGKRADGVRAFSETPRMLELFSKLTGVAYPWSRYSQVVVSDFIFGGMENTTATTMYEHILLDARAALDIVSHDLVAHELAHQWFGDFVTCRDWSHGWLNEGFATFFEQVEREDRLGPDEYLYGIEGERDSYLSEAAGRYQRPIVCRDYSLPIDLFDRHLYEKGCLVLHMLRLELGDALFWRGINTYLTRHAHGVVETNDLMRAFEEVSGRSFERFFDAWVYRPGHPAVKLKVGYDDGLLTVSVKQTQKPGETAVFAFELEIEVADKAGRTQRHTKSVTNDNDALVVSCHERPAWVGVDPELRIVGEVTLEVPADMLRNQLESGSSARLRWVAAQALGKRSDLPSVTALATALAKPDETWMVRAEAAAALGKVRGEQALDALLESVNVDHPKVRRAVARALGVFRVPAAAKALEKLARRDPSYLVSADALRSLGKTRQKHALKVLRELIDKKSWADVGRAGALDGMAWLGDDDAVADVMKRTRYGYPTRGRRAAISALARLSDSRKARVHFEELLDDHDPHLRIDAVNALVSLGDLKSRGPLRRALDRDLDGRVARRIREALRDMGNAGSSDRKLIRDDVEALKNELSELQVRLAKLEQKKKAKASAEPPNDEPAEESKAAADSAPDKPKRGVKRVAKRSVKPRAATATKKKKTTRRKT
ncbi:MAG: HEAT repeat domain-containing protein [Myxococcales bacterium]|nr:HEAT repeat domain-containing protein [Myxococcales bacterium]